MQTTGTGFQGTHSINAGYALRTVSGIDRGNV
jgi:hypothetical protein